MLLVLISKLYQFFKTILNPLFTLNKCYVIRNMTFFPEMPHCSQQGNYIEVVIVADQSVYRDWDLPLHLLRLTVVIRLFERGRGIEGYGRSCDCFFYASIALILNCSNTSPVYLTHNVPYI